MLQNLTLIGTGLLVLALARNTPCSHPRTLTAVATTVFLAALVFAFQRCFQHSHDCWIILAVLDLLIAGLVWARPLSSTWKRAVGWGIFGGLCALTSPIAGFTWGVLGLASAWPRQTRLRFAVACLAAGLTVSPWVVRNYLVFGRFIPIKSNLGYELWQSQCLQRGGVLHDPIFNTHPYGSENQERREYRRVGEMAFLDDKWERFGKAVRADPLDFADRSASRFIEATLLYAPFNPRDAKRYPWMVGLGQLAFPLPFLCLTLLLVTAPLRPLSRAQWVVIGVYLAYLMPYVIISYYDRYKFPLLGTEVALVVWGVHRVWDLVRPMRSEEPARLVSLRSASRARGKSATHAESVPHVPVAAPYRPGGECEDPLDLGAPGGSERIRTVSGDLDNEATLRLFEGGARQVLPDGSARASAYLP